MKQLIFMDQQNFIEYSDVKDEPLEKLVKIAFMLNLNKRSTKLLTYIENRVELHDSIWQYFVEPIEYTFLSLNPI